MVVVQAIFLSVGLGDLFRVEFRGVQCFGIRAIVIQGPFLHQQGIAVADFCLGSPEADLL